MKALIILVLNSLLLLETKADTIRPWAEYESVKHLILSAGTDYQSHDVKKEIIKNTPKDINIIIYSNNQSELDDFKLMIDELDVSSIQYKLIKGFGETMWPRDSFPFPLIDSENRVLLVDAKYYENYEPDTQIAAYLNNSVSAQKKVLEHGNLVSNRNGDCFLVKEIFANKLSDDYLTNTYACKTVTRLEHVHGIGHVDEVFKFLSDNIVVTDQEDWKEMLQEKGYEVVVLPKAELPEKLLKRGVMSQRSYVNSLILNKTILVPQYGDLATDAQALRVYDDLGFTVVGINTSYLSDYGGGSLHCLSMTYP